MCKAYLYAREVKCHHTYSHDYVNKGGGNKSHFKKIKEKKKERIMVKF